MPTSKRSFRSPEGSSEVRWGFSNLSDGATDLPTWNRTSSWIFKGCFEVPGFHVAQRASRFSVCRMREKRPSSATTGKPSFIPVSTPSIAISHWPDWLEPTPRDRYNFLFHAGKRSDHPSCRSVSWFCIPLHAEPTNHCHRRRSLSSLVCLFQFRWSSLGDPKHLSPWMTMGFRSLIEPIYRN